MADINAAEPAEEIAEEEEEVVDEPLVGIDGVHHVLQICGFANVANRVCLIAEGFQSVADFGKMQAVNFQAMSTRIQRMRQNEGAFRLGEIRVRNLEALAYWARDCKRHNILQLTRGSLQQK